jgi:S-adenosylmethionine hydrolase
VEETKNRHSGGSANEDFSIRYHGRDVFIVSEVIADAGLVAVVQLVREIARLVSVKHARVATRDSTAQTIPLAAPFAEILGAVPGSANVADAFEVGFGTSVAFTMGKSFKTNPRYVVTAEFAGCASGRADWKTKGEWQNQRLRSSPACARLRGILSAISRLEIEC